MFKYDSEHHNYPDQKQKRFCVFLQFLKSERTSKIHSPNYYLYYPPLFFALGTYICGYTKIVNANVMANMYSKSPIRTEVYLFALTTFMTSAAYAKPPL